MSGAGKHDRRHEHVFDRGSAAGERGTRIVLAITTATMLLEIVAGLWFNSMALLADGWHMSSHALAIGLAAYTYATARRHAGDPRFAFGSWKIEILGGFASALFLLLIGALMVVASVQRFLDPQPIRYVEAMGIAAIGLAVNIVCAIVLGHAQPDDTQQHDHHHHDLNLKSAYLHVIADAATSVLAIIALAGGLAYGWSWLDPMMGIVGAGLIAVWAKGLLVETSAVLLDREMHHPVVAEIRAAVESDRTRITDLHVWRVGRRAYACIVAVTTSDAALTADQVRAALSVHDEIAHVSVEINRPEPY
jgi:cation diffusion facilitator family transporter